MQYARSHSWDVRDCVFPDTPGVVRDVGVFYTRGELCARTGFHSTSLSQERDDGRRVDAFVATATDLWFCAREDIIRYWWIRHPEVKFPSNDITTEIDYFDLKRELAVERKEESAHYEGDDWSVVEHYEKSSILLNFGRKDASEGCKNALFDDERIIVVCSGGRYQMCAHQPNGRRGALAFTPGHPLDEFVFSRLPPRHVDGIRLQLMAEAL